MGPTPHPSSPLENHKLLCVSLETLVWNSSRSIDSLWPSVKYVGDQKCFQPPPPTPNGSAHVTKVPGCTQHFNFELYSEKYNKTCVKRSLSERPKILFQDQLSLNADQK